MRTHGPHLSFLISLHAWLLSIFTIQTKALDQDNDINLFSFVTRPDIRAPKWAINVYHPELVSPGYWFVAPYENINQATAGKGWIGPHIYDNTGELIWSGAPLVHNWNVDDFRVSTVRGESLMTFLLRRAGSGYIMDSSYTIRESIDMGTLDVDFDSHEFNFLGNGTSAVIIHDDRREVPLIPTHGVQPGSTCHSVFNRFVELDATTWHPVFEWNSYDHVPLRDSSFLKATYGSAQDQCQHNYGFDYFHANSVDKDHEGNFLLSARHTDTIYKISKDDGHIMWRLCGSSGSVQDFTGNVVFSRQHNVRFRGFNGTHEFITILDNARGQDSQPPTHSSSRGLVIALQTASEPKTATIVSAIEHPHGPGSYTSRRGNYQVLPNGHVFMGWSEEALHSEHTSDGTLIMDASVLANWLGTYRSYKFTFVGKPVEPPSVVSTAFHGAAGDTTTLVFASQNGATEIDHWDLYKTTKEGEPLVKIMEKKRTGFETAMAWNGYASYVMLRAIDKNGTILASSAITKTIGAAQILLSADVADEVYWQQEVHGENEAWASESSAPAYRGLDGVLLGIVAATAVCSAGLSFWAWQRRTAKVPRQYRSLEQSDQS